MPDPGVEVHIVPEDHPDADYGVIARQGSRVVRIPKGWESALLDALLEAEGMEAVPKEDMKRYRDAWTLQQLRAGRYEYVPKDPTDG